MKKNSFPEVLYNYGDTIKFKFQYEKEEPKELQGTVEIIDRYGTFEQNEEPSYDIMVDMDNNGTLCLFKHIRQSLVELVKKKEANEQ